MKKILCILYVILLFSFSVVAQEFKVHGLIIHPFIIDCLYSNITCQKNPEKIYFNNKAIFYLQDNIKVIDDYYYHEFENEKSFDKKYFLNKYGSKTDKKLPINSSEFYPNFGYMKYKPIFELKNFPYKPNKEKFDSTDNSDGVFSHWLIKVESSDRKKDSFFAFIVVELFQAKNNTDKSFIRALQIVPFEWIDTKYGYDFEYVDRNQDGYKDIVFYKKSGGTGIQNYTEEIHFFNENKTEVFENEYRTENTHWVGLMPDLDEEIRDLIKKEQHNIGWNENIFREVIFTKDSFPSDKKFSIKISTRTLIESDDENDFELVKKIAKNYAKNISEEYKCGEKPFTCEIQSSYNEKIN